MQASPQQCCCFSLCRVVLRVNPDPWCATSGPGTRVWHPAAESFSAPDAALFWVCGRVKQGKQAPWQLLPVSHLLAWALLSQLPNDIHTSAAQTQGGGVSAREHLPWRCQGGAGQAAVGWSRRTLAHWRSLRCSDQRWHPDEADAGLSDAKWKGNRGVQTRDKSTMVCEEISDLHPHGVCRGSDLNLQGSL